MNRTTRNTLNRVYELTNVIDKLQARLGQAAAVSGDQGSLRDAREIAADISDSLNHWHLDLLQIPPAERERYLSPNPYLER